jgi:hypothetical protein
MARWILAALLLAVPVYAANKGCPKGTIASQSATGPNPDIIIPSASSLSVQASIVTTGTATVIVEQSCDGGTNWAKVAGSDMALDVAGTKSMVMTYTAPACWFRTNITTCTACTNVRPAYGCGR